MSEHSNLTRGTKAKIDATPIEDGKIRFCTDEGRLYIDYNDKRIEVSDVITDKTAAQLKVLQNPLKKLYLASDTKAIYYPCTIDSTTVLKQITGDTYISNVAEGTTSYSKVYNFYVTMARDDITYIVAIEVPTLSYVNTKLTGINVEVSDASRKGQVYYTLRDGEGVEPYTKHYVDDFGKNLDISENATITSVKTDIGKRVYDVGIVSDPNDSEYGTPYYECLSVATVWKKYYITNFGKHLDISQNSSINNIYNLITNIDIKIADHERRISALEQQLN